MAVRPTANGSIDDVSAAAGRDEVRIPLVEETLRVGKRVVETGRVQVSTVVDAHNHVVRSDLARSNIEVRHVPIDRRVDAVPPERVEGGVTIISIVDEVAVIERQLILREEVHIRRIDTVEAVEQTVTLRSMRAVVDRDGTNVNQTTATTGEPVMADTQNPNRSTTAGAPAREANVSTVAVPKKTNWLPWLALALGVLALLWYLARHNNTESVNTATTTSATAPVDTAGTAPADPNATTTR